MDRVIKPFEMVHSSVIEPIVFGDPRSCPIDQTASVGFNIDPDTGNPMSTFDVLMKADKLEQRRILDGLQEYKSNFLPSDISDTDAIRFALPRTCQLPSELAEYQSALTERELERQKKIDEEIRLRDLFKDDVEPKS